ncbi:MAG: hypothetical protein A2W90_19600 [Bacteroidetes bacterium GWF2_42_66]|nr:MAG: hypothetical protein A2W92_17880 [Bacteroidetes bacterium GWA2_42_15]OFX98634.1 MAG: hypothetical protein A2W89_10095 [Bacteroidetes bacterium GWE2_42_39]OFY43169.1 MAG: hypothetical protein A2W90_19600 [Bacteroidetes bacterium GWF2_42_66]HBL76978.1 hypothetical protein [Prolixibacteraceae bacterium]HCR89620.1 hypothetical protein [Prolixibacteraceae bacterium]
MKRLKKRYLISVIVIVFVCIVLFFMSALVKNWLVKNSESLVGRKLDIGELHFNYAKVSVQAKDVVLYEANKVDSFFSFRELYIDFSPWKLLGREYSLSEIRLDQPHVQIIQNDEQFNFDDMLQSEDSTVVAEPDSTGKSLKFSIYNIKLTGGKLAYTDVLMNNRLDFNNLNLELPLIAWNNKQSDVGATFTIGERGRVELKALVDNQKNTYQIDVKTTDVSITPVTGYLKDYMDVESMDGLLTSAIQISGDMNDVINIDVTGGGKVTGFRAKDGRSQEIFSASEVRAGIAGINLKTFHFGFSRIEADNPHLQVVIDKDMTNLERFLLPYFRNDSIAEATADSTSEAVETTYAIDTLRINNGEISIADNTLNRPFIYSVNDLDMAMAGLTESAGRIPITFSAKLNNRGTIDGTTVLNMLEPMNVEFDGKLKRLDLVSFSPYSEYYIASPITQGWFNYDLQLRMNPTSLTNQNKIKVEELEFGKRTKDTTSIIKAPVRLALYVMKDVNDIIDIDMPVSGNPSEPQFKLGKLIWKTFANLMVKTAASPFKAMAGLAGTDPESMERLRFELAQDSLNQVQKSKLVMLATILKKKTELVVQMTQHTDVNAEKEKLAVKLAEEDFRAAQGATIPENAGSAFEAFVRQRVPALDSLGMEKSCQQFVASSRVDNRLAALLEQRNQQIRDFLITGQGLPESSVHVSTADLKNLPEELRIPEYKIEVSLK